MSGLTIALTNFLSEIRSLPSMKNALEHSSGAKIDCMFTIRSNVFGRGYLRDTPLHYSAAQKYLNTASSSTEDFELRRTDHCKPDRSRKDAPYGIPRINYDEHSGTAHGQPPAHRKSNIESKVCAEVAVPRTNIDSTDLQVLLCSHGQSTDM
jgi:hypothetical protein